MKPKPPKAQTISVEKKIFYINIDFKGDRVTDVRLPEEDFLCSNFVKRFPAAQCSSIILRINDLI